jgi:hypothetical protein
MEETVAVPVISDDLACVVGALRNGFVGGRGIVDGGVFASAQKEAVAAAGVAVKPDDLAEAVDATCLGKCGG